MTKTQTPIYGSVDESLVGEEHLGTGEWCWGLDGLGEGFGKGSSRRIGIVALDVFGETSLRLHFHHGHSKDGTEQSTCTSLPYLVGRT